MYLSIIIVNWNTRQLLAECLDSIYASPPDREFEIWVVDNNSQDGSQRMLQELYPEVNLIANSCNPGFARANNQAMSQCSGDYILLLNPDTVVIPGALTHLMRFLDEHPEAGAAGPRLINSDGSLQISAYPQPTLWREFWRLFHMDNLHHWALYPMKEWEQSTPRQVDVVMGACLMIRRKALDQIGLFDEDYFMYSEEVDLCCRIRQAGWSIFWVPQAVVLHYGGQSTDQVAAEMFLHLYQGKILYFRKHYSWLSVQLYKVVLLLASLGRVALTPIAFIEPPERRKKYLELSDNYRRLIGALPNL
jgi:hypothetical protein